ncbi:MAG: hypothetical protein IH868_07320 [Chloroflexi bacterium]|nr:hypothetical protein [Chloroflexota bacterium]
MEISPCGAGDFGYFDGPIGDVAIYRPALSADDIKVFCDADGIGVDYLDLRAAALRLGYLPLR